MKIQRKSIKDQVYDTLKDRILSGYYDFGDPLNISTLSSELGVSNTPIREVLSKLESEGLLVSSYSSQVRVIDISEELIHETDTSVLAFLVGAYDLCLFTGRIDKVISLLEDALEKQKKALQDGTTPEAILAAIAFDKCFVAATENEKLLSLFGELEPIMFLLTNYNHKQNTLNQARNLEEHEAILTAVKAGDADKVREQLRTHYDKHVKK